MEARKVRRADRALRPAMRSPGRPPVGRREHRERFWESLVGCRARMLVWRLVCRLWLVRVGSARMAGWSLFLLSLFRGVICLLLSEKRLLFSTPASVGSEIARQLGRSPSTISRELRRNAATRSGGLEYRATNAQWDRRASRPKVAKLAENDEAPVRPGSSRWHYRPPRWQAGAGTPSAVGGSPSRARKDRRWATSWSPEQISNRLRIDFPHNESMRISHEAIYQALYVQGRGALRRELVA